MDAEDGSYESPFFEMSSTTATSKTMKRRIWLSSVGADRQFLHAVRRGRTDAAAV
jgi:hypothetical protein